MLPQKHRIVLDSDFYKIKKFGHRVSSKLFLISFIVDTSLENSVFSIIVSKNIAKKSTDRNKLKRITRGLVIRNIQKLPKNLRCIIYPKLSLFSTNNKVIEEDFLELFNKNI